ncbi:MAG: nuclear transport factor 2 family protein [Fretibacterium sp.]|nr:nuclear transport factor 2 family protein [Fretibacterium sp.]
MAALIAGPLMSQCEGDVMSDEDKIREMYRVMYRHMISKDIARLGSLLDDAFALVHMTGMRQPKRDYIRAIQDGTLNYFSEEPENLEVTVNGDKASLIGQSRVNAAVFGGGRHTWRLELDIDLKRQDGRWLMTEARASTY